jgi:hypothetical protein
LEESIVVADDQLDPLYVKSRPALSVATQKLAVGHDTALRSWEESILVGDDQLLVASAVPEASKTMTATAPTPVANSPPVMSRRLTVPPLPKKPAGRTDMSTGATTDQSDVPPPTVIDEREMANHRQH